MSVERSSGTSLKWAEKVLADVLTRMHWSSSRQRIELDKTHLLRHELVCSFQFKPYLRTFLRS